MERLQRSLRRRSSLRESRKKKKKTSICILKKNATPTLIEVAEVRWESMDALGLNMKEDLLYACFRFSKSFAKLSSSSARHISVMDSSRQHSLTFF